MKNGDELSRRVFLGQAAMTLPLAFVASTATAAPPPKEGGLSSEGLLAGHPGFQPRSVAPLAYDALPGLLSAAQLSAHHAQYAEAVTALKDTEQALATLDRATADPTAYAGMRRRQVALANNVLLHEFYFGNLTAAKVEMPAYVHRHMNEHMGSFETWAEDFKLCAMAAQAWAALVYDPYDDRWHNVVMDSDADGLWAGANPLIVCDVAAHAYGSDTANRGEYVGKFLDHIDWNEVAARYHRVDRM